MSTVLITLAVLVGIVAVFALIAIGIYNRMVALRQTTNQAWSDVDVQLKQRHDLVPNLVETVKGYAGHEKSTLDAVVRARNAAVSAQGPEQASVAEGQLNGALRQLFALTEAYPDLKANTGFLQLQAELSNLETKIAAARRFFNNAVAEFNTAIEQFPAVLLAGMFGFKARSFFELKEEERAMVEAVPTVKF